MTAREARRRRGSRKTRKSERTAKTKLSRRLQLKLAAKKREKR